jgi:hypothetical protein
VLAPNGTDPVPRAFAYVPRSLTPIPSGVACDTCAVLEDPSWVSVETGIDGRFTLDLAQVPLDEPVTLAIRKGRFRKVTEIVPECGTVGAAVAATTLPGASAAGDLPRLAVASGNADHLDALLVELGITEFDCFEGRTTSTQNCPAAQATGERIVTLLEDATRLSQYSILFLSCAPNIWSSYSSAQRAAIVANLGAWVAQGGRMFVTDHSYDYIAQTWPEAVAWHGPERAAPSPWEVGTLAGKGANVGLAPAAGSTYTGTIDDAAIADWLALPEIGVTSAPTIALTGWLAPWTVQRSLPAGTTQLVHGTVDWDYAGSGRTTEELPLTSQFLVNDCGRVIYSSYHTTSGASLTAQERILEYLVLDVASCLIVE